MPDYSDGHARQLEDILEDLSAGRSTVKEAAEWIRRQSPQSIHRPLRPKKSFGLGVLITVIGMVFLGMAAVIGYHSQQFTAQAVKAQGTVTEMVRRDRVQKPRYRYEVEGVEYTGVSATGTNPPMYKVGDVVEIEYLPDDPGRSRIASWAERWTGTLAVGVMGAGVTLIGLVMLVVRWLRSPH
ncbi:hypothetical protein Pan44_24330 [Caulifigura coniformis]|uniref:DUF3592 domain-containing protein n=1 Tax=Caulifigura coniformis TaxID=2527983 RepID=A0A517SE48_9PLAN|nr:DUF3592 domain-containing protein [Caulifigura coniformis]QDT54400.1 hypothetical protein Pan44_24330 [Caulifigura coniformis]